MKRIILLICLALAGVIPAGASQPATKDVDFGPYMAGLQRHLKDSWLPPKLDHSTSMTVLFKIASDGTFKSVHVGKSSGDKSMDAAGLAALTRAKSYRPLPDGAPETVDIQFTFDYNVFGANGSRTEDSGTDGYGAEATLALADPKATVNRDYVIAAQNAISAKISWSQRSSIFAQYDLMVLPSGELGPVTVLHNSGNPKFNRAVVKAIAKTFPLKTPTGAPSAVHIICTAKPIQEAPSAASEDRKSKPDPAKDPAWLNNAGVNFLNAGRYDEAIMKFRQALQLKPGYSFARDNLAIAYNNKGLKAPPYKALDDFRLALFLDFDNPTTQGNLKSVLKALGTKAESYNDQIALAKKCESKSDLVGAYVHYKLSGLANRSSDAGKRADELKPAATKQFFAAK